MRSVRRVLVLQVTLFVPVARSSLMVMRMEAPPLTRICGAPQPD